MAKNIVLLSDGTGNSASKLFKTNVWRLYQALDLSNAPGKTTQVAYYDDGVGTAAFKPLALLGGAFGWGLRRNVLDLYTFLCRHYEPGDRIYGFGFSRGAFTVRILTGLIASQGLVKAGTEGELKRLAQGAFREYRRSNYRRTVLHKVFRRLRDGAILMCNNMTGRVNYDPNEERPRPEIAFLGLWDTVAAYGLPFDELTRAWNWIFPLSFPNRDLSEKVERACHALAIDDERGSFHPLLWNERHETEENRIEDERLTQVWFAGMHSNVGGGYPDDAMSNVPLDWMMGEAERAKLDFKAGECDQVKGAANINGKMYDSRKGVGGAYRYSPRKLKDITNDPDYAKRKRGEKPNEVIIGRPKIHESVFKRVRNQVDGYSPIGLPEHYAVVTAQGNIVNLPKSTDGTSSLLEYQPQAANRSDRQEEVWNLVWWKRILYFLSVAVFSLLAAFPLYCRMTSTGEARLRFLSPLIDGVGWFLPDFLSPWISAYRSYPDQFVVLLFSFSLLVFIGSRLQIAIFDKMRVIWKSPGRAQAKPKGVIYWLRTRPFYKRLVKFIKQKALPQIVGVIAVALLLVGACRGVFTILDLSGYICAPESGDFSAASPGWASGKSVEEGKRYQLTLTTKALWKDGKIESGFGGFGSGRNPLLYLGVPLRRHVSEPWFKPIAKIGSEGRDEYPLNFVNVTGPGNETQTLVAVIKARSSGELFLFVNDVVLPFPKAWQFYYKNNHGSATLNVELLD